MTLRDNYNGPSNYLQNHRGQWKTYLTKQLMIPRKILVTLICFFSLSISLISLYANNRMPYQVVKCFVMEQSSPQLYLNENEKPSDNRQTTTDLPLFIRQHVKEDKVQRRKDGSVDPKEESITKHYLEEVYEISLDSEEVYSKERDAVPSATNSEQLLKNTEDTDEGSLKLINPINKTKQLIEFLTPKTLGDLKPDKNPHLLIDTLGCKVPKLDPWDPAVINLIQVLPPFVCSNKPMLLHANIDGSISLNASVLLIYYDLRPYSVNCSYYPIRREHELWPNYPYEMSYSKGERAELAFEVPLNEEFVGVTCHLYTNLYYQYFAFPLLKPEVEEEKNERIPPPPEHRLNVILAGIDSVSKLNFLRHFTRTRAFLKETMHPFSMRGYTKVGDNTFPNLVPMLTGHHVEHYYNESMAQTYFFDDVDLIWKDYAKRGYRTFFAEDSPGFGTFNYLKRGFYDPPTDYYLRTLMLALEDAPNQGATPKECAHTQLECNFIYDYLKRFIKIMDTRPYHAFAMVSKLTHDILNFASYSDEPTVHLLEDLWDMGALNNSMLVLFSDHGIRFGEIRHSYIGKYEELMPFMYVHFPKWFLERHPDMAKNLEINQERLITLFDVHATMLHLLDLNQDMTSPEIRNRTLGSSLLQEIPSHRTCEQANIKDHYCPCKSYEPVPKNDTTVMQAAQAIADDINQQLSAFSDLCAKLEVEDILEARVNEAESVWNPVNQAYTKHKDFVVTLMTKPGQALFDGTVRYESFIDSYKVLGISRINMYRDQSKCINSQKMKIFCFCTLQT